MPASPSSQSRRSTGRHRRNPDGIHLAMGRSSRPEAGSSTSLLDRTSSANRADAAVAYAADDQLISLSSDRRELLCSVIGLGVKFGLVAVAAVSLFRLSLAYQQRMDRQGEISAVLELETAKLVKSRQRFDQLFTESGEQLLIREQSQWIAPNRLRVVWQTDRAFPTVETAKARPGKTLARP